MPFPHGSRWSKLGQAVSLEIDRTLCFSRSSLFRGALMITRRWLEGALKWALRDFLREEWMATHETSE